MRIARALVLPYLLLLLVSFSDCQSERNRPQTPIPSATPALDSAKQMAAQLGSPDPMLRDEAATSIIKLAAESDEFRTMVVTELVANVEAENHAVIRCDTGCPEKYEKWRHSVEILGELKASTAIPALVKRIDFNDGRSGMSLTYYPCAKALVKIGPASVQPLFETFTGNDSDLPQILAVWTLRSIGDTTARSALVKVLAFERNRLRLNEIKLILKDWPEAGESDRKRP